MRYIIVHMSNTEAHGPFFDKDAANVYAQKELGYQQNDYAIIPLTAIFGKDLNEEEAALLRAGRKLEAVKRLRWRIVGLGLKEAVDLCDNYLKGIKG